MNTYYIGGSPCSGKSTVAERLAQQYGLYYFKVDDFLEKYTKTGASRGYEICRKECSSSNEQIWMRDPQLQCQEELIFYREIFEFIMEDLKQIRNVKGIITEGAAYMPELMKEYGIPEEEYLALTPTSEFQLFHYSQREWVPYFLEGCSDKEKAFDHWMNRDIFYAKEVQKQCGIYGYCSVINDGSTDEETLAARVAAHFKLKKY